MCGVQLSDSALERLVARRTFPYHRRTAVCRSLFGSVDHEALNRELQSQLQEIQEEHRHKWDFDFQKDAPLPGSRYLWEEASAQSVPAFYRSPCRLSQGQPPEPSPCADSQPGDTKECALTTNTGATRRGHPACHITDFLPVRKKAKDGKALCDKACAGLPIPTEQTPRKLLR